MRPSLSFLLLFPLITLSLFACGEEGLPSGGGGTGGGAAGSGGEAGAGGEPAPGWGGSGGEGGEGGFGGSGGSGGEDESPAPGRVALSFAEVCLPPCNVVRAGWTRQLEARVWDSWGVEVEGAEVEWLSSDEAILSVDQIGLVTALGVGNATVFARAEGAEGRLAFAVRPAAVAAIEIEPSHFQLVEGSQTTLSATAYGLLADGSRGPPLPHAEIEWSVANPLVARIVEAGVVEAVGPGATWIIAESPDGIPAHDGKALLVVESERSLPAPLLLEDIALGVSHGCGIQEEGPLLCWGRNDEGQLGRGFLSDPLQGFPFPAPVDADPTLHLLSQAAHYGHCGVDGENRGWCWGSNSSGGLAMGEELAGWPAPLHVLDGCTQITLGLAYGCGLDAEGRAWCWGSNADGTLGNGISFRSHPEDPRAWRVWDPELVEGEHIFQSIRAGLWTVCGLDDEGAAWCWGDNRLGTLGNGDDSVPDSALPLAVAGELRFERLAVSSHACGITAEGELWCWGRNSSGQLGHETEPGPYLGEAVSFTPRKVESELVFREVAVGAFHTCALDEDGKAWCWGNNEYGQTGSGDPAKRIAEPTPVFGELRFRSLSANSHGTCGISSEGGAWCWGSNSFGVLGIGQEDGMAPVPWPMAQPLPAEAESSD